MVDQSYQSSREIPQQELDDQFQKSNAGDLKAIIPILCPHIMCAYDLNNLTWSKLMHLFNLSLLNILSRGRGYKS